MQNVERNKLTQNKLAEKLGVSEKSIGNWENGRNMSDLVLMKPLCKELNITINDLLSGEKVDNKNYQEKFEENILNAIKYSNEKTIKTILFYIQTFFFGIIIIPTLGIIAPSFILCSIIVPLSGLLKLIGYTFKFKIPFIIFQIGSLELNPIIGFIFSIIIGLVLYLIGKISWKLLLKYIKNNRIKLEN